MNHTIERITSNPARRNTGRLIADVTGASPRCMQPNTFLADRAPAELQVRDDNGAPIAVICSRAPGQHVQSYIDQFGLDGAPRAEKLAAVTTNLEHLVVAPHARGQGLAADLLAAAEEIHTAAGVPWWYTIQPASLDLDFLVHHGWTEITSLLNPPDEVFGIFGGALLTGRRMLFKQLNPAPTDREQR